MSLEDAELATDLSIATMEAALTDATGHENAAPAAMGLMLRDWTLADLAAFTRLTEHAVTTGTALASGYEPTTDPARLAFRARTVGFYVFDLLDRADLRYGKSIAFEWMRILLSAPERHLNEYLLSARGPKSLVVLMDETTPLLGDLAPLAWAAGVPMEEALTLADTARAREALTVRATGRGFRFPD